MTYTIIGLLGLITIYLMFKVRNDTNKSSVSFRSISVNEAKEMIQNNKPTILDVRSSIEVSSGKISNAVTINVASPSFINKVNKLDKSNDYIVYCRSGRRSAKACTMMAKEGFTNLYNLKGGFIAWK